MKRTKSSKKQKDIEKIIGKQNSDKKRTVSTRGYSPTIFTQVLALQKKSVVQSRLSETKSKNRV